MPQDLEIFYHLMVRHLVLGTLLLLAYWFALGRDRRLFIAVIVISVFVYLPSIPALSIPYLLTLVTLASICRCGRIPRWTFIPLAALAMVLLQLRVATPYIRRFHELGAVRDNNPPISLVDRLAYEKRSSDTNAPQVSGAPRSSGDRTGESLVPFDEEIDRCEKRLEHYQESEYRRYRRVRSLEGLAYIAKLEHLHNHVAFEFIKAEGAGAIRAIVVDISQPAFAISDLPELKFPRSADPESVESPEATALGEKGLEGPEAPRQDAAPGLADLRDTHESSALDFVNRDGFGHVVSPDRVYGFQPHGFRAEPRLPETDDRASAWHITNLELISLLKHETPAAYVSDSLPRMDKLVEFPTRPLDDFEANALTKLRAGEQIVVEPGSGEIRMLGSLRAAKQCLQCHSVSRGDLLGAFSYRIRRSTKERPIRVREPLL